MLPSPESSSSAGYYVGSGQRPRILGSGAEMMTRDRMERMKDEQRETIRTKGDKHCLSPDFEE